MADFEPIKIPFEIPVAEIAKDTERVQESFADTDKSVARAEAKFNSWVKSQLQGAKATGSNVQVTKQYTSVLATLERRMKMAQDPKLVQAYANSIAKLKNEVNTLGRNAAAVQPMKKGFDGLGNSINMITRDLPSFTYGAQMGFMAISNNIPILTDEIGRLTKRNKELLASGQKTKPVWKQVIGSLLSWQTALSMGIVLLTVYGKEIGEWIGSLFKGEKAVSAVKMRIDALNAAFKSSKVKKARKDILELKATFASAEKGIISKDKALKEYNKTLGKLAGKTDSYAKAERKLMNQSDEYLKMLTYKQAAYAALDAANDKIISNEQKRLNLDKDLERAEENIKKFKGLSYTSGVIVSQFGVSTTSPIAKADAKLHAAKMAVAAIREEKKNLEDTSVATFNNLMKNAKEIAEKNNFKLFSESDTEEDAGKVLNSHKQLLDKIAALDSEYARKSFAKDKQELQALRDKFDKIRQEVAKFNKNPKNKVKIDGSQLDTIQKNAENDLVYRQETVLLKKQLDEEREMYAAYEAFKYDTSTAEADKKYKKQLEQFGNYGEKLKTEIAKLEQDITQSPGATPTGGQTERLGYLNAKLADWQSGQDAQAEQRFVDAYQSVIGYEEKLLQIKQDYATRKAEIEKISDATIREGKLKELEYQTSASIDAVNSEAYEKATIYERLSTNLIGITKRELANRIASLKEYLKEAKGSLSAEQQAFLKSELKKAEAIQASTDIGVQEEVLLQRKHELITRIKEKQAKGLVNVQDEVVELEEVNAELANIVAKKAQDFANKAGQLGSAFKNLGAELKEYDEGLGDTVETMGELMEVAADVGGAVASFASGDIVGGITKSIAAITKVLSIGARARESERKALEEIKKWHDEIFESQLAYNAELRKRIAEEVKLNDLYKSRVDNFKEELEANREMRKLALEDQEAVFKRLLNSKTIVDKYTKKHGGFLGVGRKTKVVNVERTVGELLTSGYEGRENFWQKLSRLKNGQKDYSKVLEMSDELFRKIEILNRDKPLTGDAKEAYETLKKLKNEYGSLERAKLELQKQLKDATVGFTARSIADAIKEGVKSGKKTFADFAGDIEDFLRQAILSGMSAKVLEPEMQKLQDMLYGMLGDGVLTGDEKKQWQEAYMKVAKEANEYVDMMKHAGIDVVDKTASANSLQGAVRGMTEQKADLLAGQLGGYRLTQLDTNKILRSSHTAYMAKIGESIRVSKQIEINTRKTAENTNGMREGFKAVETAVKQRSNTMAANGI